MKAEFLKSFDKDISKVSLQKVKDNIAEVIENVENAINKTDIEGIKKLKGF